ncbi:DUF5819 family protein [Streptomyces sp. NPDC006798]|uniref:DUF5819 family protein n=1 Tax=Streptomyces sp. NPDC006798 TaxID=3155462 RepID=UPI0033F3461B
MDSYEHEGAREQRGRRPGSPPDGTPPPPSDRRERESGPDSAAAGAEASAPGGTAGGKAADGTAGGKAADGTATGVPAGSAAGSAGGVSEPGRDASGEGPGRPGSGRTPGAGDEGPGAAPTAGLAALSFPYQVTAAVVLGLAALVGAVHLLMVFLHVAPSNTASKEYSEAVDGWVLPEFEQNWKLFAPNPLQQNITIQVKAELSGAGGEKKTTEWIDLGADDVDAIRGSLLPSHTAQNQLRRAWDFYTGSHDDQNRATGLRGEQSETYLRRLVMLRIERDHDLGGRVERIQIRSVAILVQAPPWSKEKADTRPSYRVLPWWNVTDADRPLGHGVRAADSGKNGGKDGAGANGERAEAAR